MSAKVLELLQSSVDFSLGENECLEHFLESCLEHGAFYCASNADSVVKTINTTLNSSFDRGKGLTLLLAFLPQTSVEVFSDNAVSWMVQCSKIIHQKGEIIYGLGLKTLTKLIQLSVKFPEVNKETAKQIVPKFLLNHVRRRTDPSDQVPLELLECLQACMSEYSGPSGEFRLDILKLLLSTVEGRLEVVNLAARCVPLVARLGGGGKHGVSYKAAWQSQHLALVALLHDLLNKIYEHIDTGKEEITSVADVQLTLDSVNESSILRKTQRLATQFTSIAHFLQAMLLEEFPVAKSVAQDAILDLISHAGKPTHAALGTSREVLVVLTVLPSIQVAAMRVLESLVLCVGRNLVPRGCLVCFLCSQVIMWTRQEHSYWPYAMDKPYSGTRLAAYCCLHAWLTVAGAASQADNLTDKTLPTILSDIHTEKPTVRLRVGSKTGKGKKKQHTLFSVEDRSEKLGNSFANSRLCERALQTLTLLVRIANSTLKPDTYMRLVRTVLTLVAELPAPYSDINCHSALLQLLLALCLDPHPSASPPLAPALATFIAGLHHSAPEVKASCEAALSSLENVVRPTAATLYFPVPREVHTAQVREREDSETPPKRRKLDPDQTNSSDSIVLDDSNDGASVKSLDSKTCEERIIEIDISEESREIETVPENMDTLEKSTVEFSTNDYNNENVEERTKIYIDDERVEMQPLTDENKVKSTSKEDSDENEITDVQNIQNNIDTKTDSSKMYSEIVANEAVNEELEDADVSQMLLDFKDEVASEIES